MADAVILGCTREELPAANVNDKDGNESESTGSAEPATPSEGGKGNGAEPDDL